MGHACAVKNNQQTAFTPTTWRGRTCGDRRLARGRRAGAQGCVIDGGQEALAAGSRPDAANRPRSAPRCRNAAARVRPVRHTPAGACASSAKRASWSWRPPARHREPKRGRSGVQGECAGIARTLPPDGSLHDLASGAEPNEAGHRRPEELEPDNEVRFEAVSPQAFSLLVQPVGDSQENVVMVSIQRQGPRRLDKTPPTLHNSYSP